MGIIYNPKFKKGDKVERFLMGINMPLGTRAIVEEVSSGGYIRLKGHSGWHNADRFKLVEHETIVITTDGDIGKAKIIKGGKVVREVKLVRQKGDKHDLKALAAWAVQKLIPNDGNMIINVKAGYTGAVAVINSKNPAFADGKIIEFVSGKCTTAMLPYAKEFNTLEDVKRCFKKEPYNFDVVELHRR
jgi:hypothetical protein